MRNPSVWRSPVLMLCLAACAGPETLALESAGLEGRSATISFDADWQTRVDGALEAGGVAYLEYAPTRLEDCRGTQYGNPAWTISAHYRVDGGDVRSVHVAGHSPSPDAVGLPLELDRAGELEIWFENTSAFGCRAWDSAFGENYRFTVAPASVAGSALARFPADGSHVFEGAPRQSGTLAIEYDASRLPACRATRYGSPAWNILAHYRFASGRTGYVPVVIGGAPTASPTLDLAEGGELELWFEAQDYYGCREWDSLSGANYRVVVDVDPRAPGWMGNAASVIDRRTCDAGPCDTSRVALESGFTHGTYARQRAAIRAIYFDVWKSGVTDRDNPDLWRDLDVQVHFRWRSEGAFQTRYVSFMQRVGNDARYELPMSALDPLAGSFTRTDPAQCPDAELLLSGDPDSVYVAARVEYYFTVNGIPLRRADGANFSGTFEEYRAQFDVCLPPR